MDDWQLNTQPGVEVRQYTCNGETNQDWTVRAVGDGYCALKNRLSGLCLDNWGWANTAGSEVGLYT